MIQTNAIRINAKKEPEITFNNYQTILNPEWLKCLQMALYYKPQNIEEQMKMATSLYEEAPCDQEEIAYYWIPYLEMASHHRPRDVEEQIKIASGIYKYTQDYR
jgi:hypothetical protein